MAITADGIVTVVTGVLQTGGIITFVYFLIRGLRQQITTLNTTVEQQQKTLEVMERRVVETEKFGEMYRRMLADLPADMEKFKEVISHLKDATIAELEKANQSKDEKLKGLTELELKKIEVTEKAIQELPALREELLATVAAIQQRVETALQYVPEPRLRGENRALALWRVHVDAPSRRHRFLPAHLAAVYTENYDDVLEDAIRRLALLAADAVPVSERTATAAKRGRVTTDVEVAATAPKSTQAGQRPVGSDGITATPDKVPSTTRSNRPDDDPEA